MGHVGEELCPMAGAVALICSLLWVVVGVAAVVTIAGLHDADRVAARAGAFGRDAWFGCGRAQGAASILQQVIGKGVNGVCCQQ